jgi:hypothetical protein
MMRWIILAVLVVVLSAAATVVVQILPSPTTEASNKVKFPVKAKTDGPPPAAVVDGDLIYRFGTMRQDDKGHHKWSFRNEGKGDLLLTMISSTCSCTVANLKDGKTATVKPGDSTEVELEWETRKNNGAYSKSATIGTNDAEHPTFVLAVEGTVRPAVMVFPADETINYLEISTDEEDHTGRAGVYTIDRDDFEITKITTSKPGVILVEKEPMNKTEADHFQAKKGYRLTVNVKSGMPLGSFREEVVVQTNHPQQPEVRLYLMGKMVGPISVTPERVRMPDVSTRRGESRTLKMMVRGQEDTAFRVEKQPDHFKVEVQPGPKHKHASEYQLTITALPGVAPGTVDDEVVLKTDHPKAAELRVPVYLFVHDGN